MHGADSLSQHSRSVKAAYITLRPNILTLRRHQLSPIASRPENGVTLEKPQTNAERFRRAKKGNTHKPRDAEPNAPAGADPPGLSPNRTFTAWGLSADPGQEPGPTTPIPPPDELENINLDDFELKPVRRERPAELSSSEDEADEPPPRRESRLVSVSAPRDIVVSMYDPEPNVLPPTQPASPIEAPPSPPPRPSRPTDEPADAPADGLISRTPDVYIDIAEELLYQLNAEKEYTGAYLLFFFFFKEEEEEGEDKE